MAGLLLVGVLSGIAACGSDDASNRAPGAGGASGSGGSAGSPTGGTSGSAGALTGGGGGNGGSAGSAAAAAAGGTAGCGQAGEACCAGSTCDVGLMCDSGSCLQNPVGPFGTPCTKAAECPTALCVPVGGGQNSCTAYCPKGTECLPGWQCAPILGQNQNVCQCTGGAETCNGQDDDCNGIVDDPSKTNEQCATNGGAGYVCKAGQCSCGLTPCGQQCIDSGADAKNCGACGNQCGFGAICTSAQCGPQAAVIGDGPAQTPSGTAIVADHDADSIYWDRPTAGLSSQANLFRVSKVSGTTENLTANTNPPESPWQGCAALGVDQARVYCASSSKLYTRPKAGFGSCPDPTNCPFASVSWLPVAQIGNIQRVVGVRSGGGAVFVRFSSPAPMWRFVTSGFGLGVETFDSADTPSCVAVAPSGLAYYVKDGKLLVRDIESAKPKTTSSFIASVGSCHALAITADSVFIATSAAGPYMRVLISSAVSKQVTLMPTPLALVGGNGSTFLYESSEGLYAFDMASEQVVHRSPMGSFGLRLLDDSTVYWVYLGKWVATNY